MKTLTGAILLWVPLAAIGARTTAQDLDPVVVARSNPPPPRGSCDAVAVRDGVAYCAMGGYGLVVYDVRDPARPSFLGAHQTAGAVWGRAQAVSVFGAHVCVAGSGLSIFDVEDPSQPRLVGQASWEAWPNPSRVVVEGSRAYVAVENGLLAFDLGDPAQPQWLGQVALGPPEWPVYPRGLAVSGEYAFISYSKLSPGSVYESGVKVIALGDPRRLTVAADHPIPGDAGGPGSGGGWAIAVQGAHAFVADGSSGLVVLDVQAPTAPRYAGSLQIPDGAMSLAQSGPYVYVSGGRLHTIDVSDPARPRLRASTDIGGAPGQPYYVEDLVAVGEHLYAAFGRGGLRVLTLQNPTRPEVVGRLETDGFPYDMVVRGQHAIVAEGWAGLQIVDVSDPNRTRRVGSHATDGRAIHLAVQGDLAYTVSTRWDEGTRQEQLSLESFDLKEASNPERLGHLALARFHWSAGLSVSGNVACLAGAGDTNWIEIIDVGNPANLIGVGGLPLACGARAVVLKDGQAFLGTECGLEIVDLQDPAKPKSLGRMENVGSIQHVALAGNRLYLTAETLSDGREWTSSLSILDVANPAAPRVVGNLAGVVGKIAANDERVFELLYNSVRTVDVTDPARPRWVATAWLMFQPQAASAASDGRVFVIEGLAPGGVGELWTTGIELIDFNRWANPQRIGTGRLPTNPVGWGELRVVGTYICRTSARYFDNRAEGVLAIIDPSDPTEPEVLGTATVADRIYSMAVQGTRAYLAAGSAGLQIFDLSNPKPPMRIGGLKTGFAMRVSVSGEVACVQDKLNQLSLIDVRDATNPVRIGEYTTPVDIQKVAQAGKLAFVAADSLRLLDLTEPAAPRLLARINGLTDWSGIAFSGTRAFLATVGPDGSSAELVILDFANPAKPHELGRARIQSGFDLIGLAVLDRYAYVLLRHPYSSTRLEVFDVSDPGIPIRVGGNSALNGYGIVAFHNSILVAGDNELTLMHPFVPLRMEPTAWHVLGPSVSVMGPPGWLIRVQRSADLTHWQDWRTLSSSGAPVELSDPEAGAHPHRFYRAVAP